MLPYRPDRVVRVLTALVSFAYIALLVLGIVALIGLPILKLLAGDDAGWSVGLRVPVAADVTEATVLTRWGDARLEIDDMQGSLRLPVGMVPWGLFALVWVYVAAAITLVLSFLYHLRRIFMRVRDGVPFDATNAVRLRWLGLIALGMALLSGVSGLIGLAVSGQVVDDGLRISAGLPIDGSMVFLGLVLLALAEIFRRGAELEHEQSLTV